ncbi:MAG: Holliday junction resolvase RuvX [Candidatus Omnitrophica bacterium]|nr:Holliday junction resolvase RuvX [Candidatus Omnitrophota bacterium]
MRILGLDVGERRIGVALSDPLGLTAQRLVVVQRRGPRQDVEAVARLAREHQASEIVVGLPLTMRGELGEQATKITAFAESLKARMGRPVHLVDERLTTAQSERALLETDTRRRRRKILIDQLAAQLILQAYLDGKRNVS